MQREFDAKCDKDVKDLFNLLHEYHTKIAITNGELFVYSNNGVRLATNLDILKINWNGLTEIHRPVDYSEYIGKLGWFWMNTEEDPIIGILKKIFSCGEHKFLSKSCIQWRNFKPLTLAEIKEKKLAKE